MMLSRATWVWPLMLLLAAEVGAQERVNVDPKTMTLAPGRRGWVRVMQLVITSPSSAKTIAANVLVTSDDSTIAEARPDSESYWALDAKRPGSTRIAFRSRSDTARVAYVDVTVRRAPLGNESGLTYSASARLVPAHSSSPLDPPLGPMDVAVTVRIQNTAKEPRDFWLSRCAVWIRFYRTRDKSRPPVKDVPRDVGCGGGEEHVTLAPGTFREFSDARFRVIERDTLATGPHYVVAVLDRVRDLKEVDAGSVDIVSPNAGLRMQALVSRDSGHAMIHARVAITNTNRDAVRLEYGACSVSWLAYRDSATGKPVWNSFSYGAPPGMDVVCPTYLASGRVAPGQTVVPKEFSAAFDPAKILGDSLPPGRYYFTARVELNWRRSVVEAGGLLLTRERGR